MNIVLIQLKKKRRTRQWGEKSKGQGERTDLKKICGLIKEGKKLKEIWDMGDDFSSKIVQYHKGLSIAYELSLPKKDATRDVKVVVLYGKTGLGKTRMAKAYANQIKKDSYYFLPAVDLGKTVWFDGYTDQETLIIDDFAGTIGIDYILRLLDKYTMQLQIKGGFTTGRWSNIVVTSNYPIEDWYTNIGQKNIRGFKKKDNYLYLC